MAVRASDVLGHGDLLERILALCRAQPPDGWDAACVRGVCRSWRDVFDNMDLAVQERQLCRTVEVPLWGEARWVAGFKASRHYRALQQAVHSLELQLWCSVKLGRYIPFSDGDSDYDELEYVAAAKQLDRNNGATLLLNSAVLAAVPAVLDTLQLTLPYGVAAQLDRLLGCSRPGLRRLSLSFDSWDISYCGEDEWKEVFGVGEAAGGSLALCMRLLPGLQVLEVTSFPGGPLNTQVIGPCLPSTLTSLRIWMETMAGDCLDIEAITGDLAHLSTLRQLQHLELEAVLGGPQNIPEALARLTYLSLARSGDLTFEGGSGLGALPALQELNFLNSCASGQWPRGIEELEQLTHLSFDDLHLLQIIDAAAFPPPPDFSRLTNLQYLSVGNMGGDPWPLPGLTPLCRLRHLACSNCAWEPIAEGLPALRHLTCLDLASCKQPEDGFGLDVGSLGELEQMFIYDCALREAPYGLTQLTALVKLNLAMNHIRDIDTLRQQLRGLPNLRELNLDNQLELD